MEFLESLGPNLKRAGDGLWALLNHVSTHGPLLNSSLRHQLRGDIYEFIKGRIRILYFCDSGRVIVCTHALKKQRRSIGNAEIKKAEKVMTAY
ncbi:MAG: type II toxin-antitoxin system RelE/ParE family toxin, partial [Gammaproteobacteria bacterium]